jgi:hypothetical protein
MDLDYPASIKYIEIIDYKTNNLLHLAINKLKVGLLMYISV